MKARIIFLLLAALILAAAFLLLPSAADPEDGEVTVAVATDLHYLASELTDFGEFYTGLVTEADGKAMPHIEELVRAFAEEIAAGGPDALVLSGDLTFNGEKLSHERLAEILARVEAAGVPVYVIPGNHDLMNPSAARFTGDGFELVESVTAEEFAEIYAAFGYDEALSRDAGSLSYSARLAPGLRLLCVDVNASGGGWVPDGSLLWVEEELRAARAAGERVLAVSHQNLYMHNPLFLSGYVISNSAQLEELYHEYGVLANLSGHIHLQHFRTDRVPEIVTESLAVSPNRYGLLTLTPEALDYAVRSVDVPAVPGFAEWSAGFFRDTAVGQALAELGEGETERRLAEFYAQANALYFAGESDGIVWDEALMDEWSARSFFTPMYLESIQDDGGNYTALHLALE